MIEKIEDLKFWHLAVVVLVAALAVVAVIFVLVGIPEQTAFDREKSSIEPGVIADSNGNAFKPNYRCFRNGCTWTLERLR